MDEEIMTTENLRCPLCWQEREPEDFVMKCGLVSYRCKTCRERGLF